MTRDLDGTVLGAAIVSRGALTGAMNRYPRRVCVSINRGFSAESPNASRSFAMAAFRP